MKSLDEIQALELTWEQPSRRKRWYELRAADAVLASLHFEKSYGNRAVATTSEGEWMLQKSGLLKPIVSIRRTDLNLDVAEFRCRWDGGGTLSFRDGHIYQWKNTNRWHTAWAWSSRTNEQFLHFKRRAITLEPGAVFLPHLSLMACLTWYFNIVNNESSDASVAITVSIAG